MLQKTGTDVPVTTSRFLVDNTTTTTSNATTVTVAAGNAWDAMLVGTTRATLKLTFGYKKMSTTVNATSFSAVWKAQSANKVFAWGC